MSVPVTRENIQTFCINIHKLYILVTRICKLAPFAGTVLLCSARGTTPLLALFMQGSDGKTDEKENNQGNDGVGNNGDYHMDLTGSAAQLHG